MAFIMNDSRIGMKPIGEAVVASSVTTPHRPGTIVRAVDPVLGEAEFMWGLGTNGVLESDMVVLDTRQGAVMPRSGVASNTSGAVGVAAVTSAGGFSRYGWFQISGAAVVRSAVVVAGANAYTSATPGQIDDAVVAAKKIDNLRLKTADGTPSAGLAVVQLNRPSVNGNS